MMALHNTALIILFADWECTRVRVDCITSSSPRNQTTLSILLPLCAWLTTSSPPTTTHPHLPASDPDFPLKPLPLCAPCFLVVSVVARLQREIVLPHRREGRKGRGWGWSQRKTCASGSEGCRLLSWTKRSKGHSTAAEVENWELWFYSQLLPGLSRKPIEIK